MNSHHADSWVHGSSTPPSAVISTLDDARVVAALEEYIQMLRGGWRPGRAEFLARHESIAGILGDRLEDLEVVQDALSPLAASGSDGGLVEDSLQSTRLGEFRIIREIGRGGMGVVYEAEQLPLGRRVALKVLPPSASLDARQRQRFQVEAQAAALLHHEHIVPVFGIGCDRGIHYFAMQFIEGRSLTEVIRSLQPVHPNAALNDTKTSDDTPVLEIRPSNPAPARSTACSLNIRQHCQMVAQFGLQAALALEHAHEIGVIHRDIKPSNLLIDCRNHLWVADFGLARLPHDEHDLTRTGDLVGTLRYMSPEQLRGERVVVDARSDIYALGVTLYELLTLRPAFETNDRNELIRRILDEEPVQPRKFNPSIARDLETIVLTAMEKEPSARYGLAQALADDLRRFLDDQPIQARRRSLIDRAVKWSRRHRHLVLASITATVVTLGASTAVLWAANRRLDKANRNLAKALNSAHSTVNHSVGTLDQIIRPFIADAGSPIGYEGRRTLPIAIQYFDTVSSTFSRDGTLQEVTAKALRQAGYYRMILGRRAGRDDYRAAIGMYERISARLPGHIWLRAGLIDTLQEYAALLNMGADPLEADVPFRRALVVAEGLLENEDAAQHCFRIQLVASFNSLAWELVRRPPARAGDAVAAVRLARKAVDWEPEQFAYWNTLGVAHYRDRNWSSAIDALKKSIDLSKGGNAADWFCLACINHEQGKIEEARRSYDRALMKMQHNPVKDEARLADLEGFRAEAVRVLGSLPEHDDLGPQHRDTSIVGSVAN